MISNHARDDGFGAEPGDGPCCTYRDHEFGCACPEHPRSALHPLGDWPEPTAADLAEDPA